MQQEENWSQSASWESEEEKAANIKLVDVTELHVIISTPNETVGRPRAWSGLDVEASKHSNEHNVRRSWSHIRGQNHQCGNAESCSSLPSIADWLSCETGSLGL